MTLEEIFEKLKNAKGYMLCVSLLTEDNRIEHTLVTEEFQKLDILPSIKELKNLAVESLEKDDIEGITGVESDD